MPDAVPKNSPVPAFIFIWLRGIFVFLNNNKYKEW